MTTTRNYARGRVWQGQARTQTTIRVPDKLYKKVTRLALKQKMTINDLLLSIIADNITPRKANG